MDRRRQTATLLPPLVALIATACGPAPAAGLSPTQVVQEYYNCVARHDAGRAARFLAPQQAKLEWSASDSDFHNIETISNVTVTQPAHIPLDGEYTDEVQVVATYTARFKRVLTADSGPQTRFLYLGRNDAGQPWLIFSIGSGP